MPWHCDHCNVHDADGSWVQALSVLDRQPTIGADVTVTATLRHTCLVVIKQQVVKHVPDVSITQGDRLHAVKLSARVTGLLHM